MRYITAFLLFLLASCEARNFDSDRRQIIAKDQARRQLQGSRNFSVSAFREDTLQSWPDSMIIHPIRYTLDFVYNDSTGNLQSKKAVAIFTPEGNDLIKTEILDQPLTGK